MQAVVSCCKPLRPLQAIALQAIAFQTIASRCRYCPLLHCKPLQLLQASALQAIASHCDYSKLLQAIAAMASYCNARHCKLCRYRKSVHCKILQAIPAISSSCLASYCKLLASYLQVLHVAASFWSASYSIVSYCKPWGYCKLSHAIAAIASCCIARFCITSYCKPLQLLQPVAL